MMWEYLRYPDDTQVAYSDVRPDGTVVVTVERPVDLGFDSARCVIPSFRWSDVKGFTEAEMARWDRMVKSNAPFIFELAQRERDGVAERV